jgi:hypothetical protein
MPLYNKIQIRRGSTSDWSNAGTTLAQGELGYDTTIKRFKIGDGTTAWSTLPWAGGSDIVSQTGIGFTFDNSANAYTVYSYITGVTGGQDGITFETLPLSGLLGNTSASGTYYRIGLSTKLENFHDSSISISGNLISSSGAVDGTGITISGFNNSAISLNPFGGTVNASGINIRNLTTGITVTEAVGGLAKGTVLSSASGITDVLKKMLEKIFEPTNTGGDVPSLSISFSGSPTSTVEAGTVTNLTISALFSQGTVRGTGTGAGWVTDGNQGVRAGAATSYTINNTVTNLATSLPIGNVTAIDGLITYGNSTVTHGTGIVPKNSIGVNSTVLSQLGAGTISAGSSISYTGRRKLFYGTSTSVISTPTSGNIIALSNSTLHPSTSTPNFNIVAPIGTRTIIIAVPSGAGYSALADSTLTVFDVPAQQYITSAFIISTVNVPAANGYVPTGYKVLTYVNGAPTIEPSTYTIDLAG